MVVQTAGLGASSSLPRAPAKVRSQTDLPTLALARQPYMNGHGVQQNYVQAHMWFDLAAAQGNKGSGFKPLQT